MFILTFVYCMFPFTYSLCTWIFCKVNFYLSFIIPWLWPQSNSHIYSPFYNTEQFLLLLLGLQPSIIRSLLLLIPILRIDPSHFINMENQFNWFLLTTPNVGSNLYCFGPYTVSFQFSTIHIIHFQQQFRLFFWKAKNWVNRENFAHTFIFGSSVTSPRLFDPVLWA